MTKITLAAALLALTAGLAHAKGHDQGMDMDETPNETGAGTNVGAETVDAAKTLGAALGNGKKPEGPNGASGMAGKPAD